MRAVSESVDEGAGAVGDRVHYLGVDDHGAERRVSTGNPFRGADDVGRPVTFRPMLVAEVAAGAAYAGHHFVRDQQDPVTAGDAGDVAQVSVRRRDGAESGAADRLKNKCGGFAVTGA